MITRTPSFDFNKYQSRRETRAAELGLTTDLTAAELKALDNAPAAGKATADRLSTLLENKQALYDQGIDDETISRFQNMALNSDDPEKMEADMLSAIAFSRNLGISVTDAYQNLDSLMDAQFFNPQPRGKTTWHAINDSFALGELTTQRGELGYKLMALDPESDEYKSLMMQYQELNKSIEDKQDYLPRSWATNILKYTGNTVPYSLKSITAGLKWQTAVQGTLTGIAAASGISTVAATGINTALAAGSGMLAATGIGLPIAALIATAGIVANRAGAYQYGVRIEGGNQYLDLLEEGIDHNTASKISYIHGMISSGIEQSLESVIGGVSTSVMRGIGIDADGLASRVITKSIMDGKLSNRLLQFGVTYGKDVIEEGLEEAFQGLSADLTKNLAFVLSDLPAPVDFTDAMKNMFQEAIGGMAGSLILGGLGAAADVRMTKEKAIYLRSLAASTDSRTAFNEKSRSILESEGLDADKIQGLQDQLWDQGKPTRDMQWKRVSDALIDSSSITETPVFDAEGNQITASWSDENEVFQLEDASFGRNADEQKHTIRFGNLDERGYSEANATAIAKEENGEQLFGDEHENAQEIRHMQMVQGASISFTTKGDTLTIDSVSIADNLDSSVKDKAVRKLISLFPDYDISWNPSAEEDIAIRDSIISQNPRGSQFGLNLSERTADNASVQYVKRWLGNNFSQDDTENSIMAMSVEAQAKRYGLTGQQFLEKYAADIQSIRGNSQAEALITANGKRIEDVKGFLSAIKDTHDNIKAVIYAGEHADISTFQHEMHHLVMAIGENKKDFREAFDRASDTAQFRRFVEKNLDIIGTVRNRNGRGLDEAKFARVVGELKQDEWTADANEFETELFNAWQRNGKSLNNEMQGIFQRIAEGIRKVFSILRRDGSGVELNKEISDYYDRLFGYDPEGKDKGRDLSSWNYSPDKNVTPLDESVLNSRKSSAADSSVLMQNRDENEEFRKVEGILKTKEFNFDEDGNHLAPNGKKSNLTYRQWVQVRTPSFKRWFGDWETIADDFKPRLAGIRENIKTVDYDKSGSSISIDMSLSKKELEKKITDDSRKNRGSLFCPALGNHITFNRDTLREVLRHDYKNKPHLASVYFIPEFIEKGMLLANVQDNANRREFAYLVSKFRYDGKEYLVRSIIKKDGNAFYYDHKLSEYKKFEELIDGLLVTSKDHPSSLMRNYVAGEPAPLYDYEDKRILSLWQGFSKVLDENGEPLVVYHGSDAEFNIFDRTKSRSNADIQGIFFSPYEEESQDYGSNVRAFFLDLRNPADSSTAYNAFKKFQSQNEAGIKAREDLLVLGYDGVDNDGEEFIAFEPNQIKSATDNNGNFDSDNSNILFQVDTIKESYEGTENYLKAPNGKATKLTSDMWATVRTPAFKSIFGDWENKPQLGNQVRAYENESLRNAKAGTSMQMISEHSAEGKFNTSSIVLDDNGEPLAYDYFGNGQRFYLKADKPMLEIGLDFSDWNIAENKNLRDYLIAQNLMKEEEDITLSDVLKRDGKSGIRYEKEDGSIGYILADPSDAVPADRSEYIGALANKNGIEEIDSTRLFDVLESPRISGYQSPDNVNVNSNSESVNPDNVLFQIAPEDYKPEKTGIGYKVFYLKDGKLYPPMVANPGGADTPVGKWLIADAAPVTSYTKTGRPQVKSGGKGTQGGSGALAYRPGWHLGEIPYAKQFNRLNPETGLKELFPKDFVWAEVEYTRDNDYNEEAVANGYNANGKFNHAYASLSRLPENGFYNYRTNPDPTTDPWIITGAMKVNRILSREEVDDLVRKAGREPQLVQGDKQSGVNRNTSLDSVRNLGDEYARRQFNPGTLTEIEPGILTQTIHDIEAESDVVLITRKDAVSSDGVSPSEWDYAVLPSDASEETYAYLSSNGIQAVPYDRNSVSDKQSKVNTATGAAKMLMQERFNDSGERYFQDYDPREDMPAVRGGWTEKKILNYLKKHGSLKGAYSAAQLIAEFDSVEELKEHMFYHGTVHGYGSLKPSITMSDREVERVGGGGYGEKYWAISVSKSKKVASNFSGTSDHVSIYPIVLAKNANVISMDLSDSADLSEHIVDLYNKGVDAVWIGGGEQELCVINPRAIVNIDRADFYKVFQLGSAENPINIKDDAQIAEMLEFSKEYMAGPHREEDFGRPSMFEQDENGVSIKDENGLAVKKDYSQFKEELSAWMASPEYKALSDLRRKRDSIVLFQTTIPDNFSEELANISENDIGKPNETIVFSENTPEVFKALGLPDLSVEMYKDKLARGLFLDRTFKHGHSDSLSKEIVASVAQNFADPMMVFESASDKKSLVAIYEITDKNGAPVLVSIGVSKTNPYNMVNIISSMYGKDNTNTIKSWIDAGLLRYIDDTNEKASKYSVSLQSASGLPAYESNLSTNKTAVNKKTGELTARLQLPSTSSLDRNNVLTKSDIVSKNDHTGQKILTQSISDDVKNELYELAYEAKDYKDFVGIVTAMVEGEFEESDLQDIFIEERGSLDAGSSEYDLDFGTEKDSSGRLPEEDIDFFGTEEPPEIYPSNPLENYTDEEVEELQKSMASAFQTVKGEIDIPDKYTLSNPDTSLDSIKAKNESFDHIIDTDDGILEYLNGLRSGADDLWDGTNIREIYDESSEEGAEIIASKEQFKEDLDEKAAPLVRAYTYKLYGGMKAGLTEYQSRYREHKKITKSDISERSIRSIRGIIRNNIDFYRNLYANATAESYWKGMPTENDMFRLEDSIINDKSLSISEIRKKAEAIQDEELRNKIIRGGKADMKEIRAYLVRAKERELSYRKETELAKEIADNNLEFVNGQLRKVTADGVKAQQDLLKAENSLNDIQDKLEKKANSLAREAQKRGLTAEEIQDQQELAKKLSQAERLRNQKQNILNDLHKEGKYYGDAGRQKAAEIDAKLDEVLKSISDLQQRKIITADEAVERLVNLSAMIGKDKLDKAVYDAVTLERWKAAKSKLEAEKKHERAVYDAVYSATLKATNRFKEREKALIAEKEALRMAYKNRIAAKDFRNTVLKMADRIMRPASHTMALEEADKLRAIQAEIDPNFRSSIRANGRMLDINELKSIYRKDPSDSRLSGLTAEQLSRLSRKSLDEMSFADLNNLYAETQNLREVGRSKRLAYLSEQKMRRSDIQRQMINIIESRDDFRPPEIGGTRERRKMLSPKLKEVKFAFLTMPTKAQILDGGSKGVFYDFLVRRKRECQEAERRNINRRSDPIANLLKERNIDNSFFYTNTRGIVLPYAMDQNERQFTFSDLAYVYLSRKSQRNVEAVSYGTLVTKQEKATIINSADANIIGTDKDAIELRKEMVDSEIRKIGDARYKAVLDLAIETVEGNEDLLAVVKAIESDFNDTDIYERLSESIEKRYNQRVEKEAYYLPISRNDYKGETPADKVKQDMLNQYDGKGRPAVNRGSTISRITISPRHQPMVNIDLFGVWQNSVYNQEHLLAFGDYVDDLNAVFSNKGHNRDYLIDAIASTEKLGKSMADDIADYIATVANPDLATAAGEDSRVSSIFRLAKGGIYSGYLGFKLSAVVMQAITSPAAFMGKVNPLRLGSSMMQLLFNGRKTYDKVFALSPFMRSRSFDLIKDEIKRAASDGMKSKFSRKYNEILNFGMEGLEWIDKYCVTAGWKAIYDQEIMRLGGQETMENVKEAVRIADEYVSETQPLSDPTEIAPYLLKGGEAMRFFTQFRASLNVIWNNAYVNTGNIIHKRNLKEAMGMTVGYIGAGILVALMRGEIGGDDGDDEDKLESIVRNILYAGTSQYVEAVPLFGDFASSIVGSFIKGEYEKPYDSSPFPALSNVTEAFGRVSEYINTPAQDRTDKQLVNAVKSVAEGTGLALGLPVSSYKDIKRVWDNKSILALFGRRSY